MKDKMLDELTRFYNAAYNYRQPYYRSNHFICPICLGNAVSRCDQDVLWAKCDKCKAEIQTAIRRYVYKEED